MNKCNAWLHVMVYGTALISLDDNTAAKPWMPLDTWNGRVITLQQTPQ